MRLFNVKLIGFIGLLLGLAVFVGCGTQDLLDEANGRYILSGELEDGGDGSLQVDILQVNCDGNATSSDDDEDFFPTLLTMSMAVAEDAPGITLRNVSIRYVATGSPNGDNTIVDPPVLLNPDDFNINWYIGTGDTESESIPVISLDTKEDYRDAVGWIQDPTPGSGSLDYIEPFPALTDAWYKITIILEFEDDNLNTKTFTIEREVLFGPWDRC